MEGRLPGYSIGSVLSPSTESVTSEHGYLSFFLENTIAHG